MQSDSHSRESWPQQVLAWLPLTLFFPIGVMYAGVLIFLISLLASGDFSAKLQRVRRSPMFWPVIALTVCSIVIALSHEHPVGEFWSAFLHYQTYWFLLLFLAAGGEPSTGQAESSGWQSRAQWIFFAGGLLSATLFYANALHLLPNVTGFKSYVVYDGNKSILLGILLALAAGWMLHAWRWHKNYHVWRGLALLYVVIALLVLAKTRTASLLFLLLCGLMLFRNFSWRWPSVLSVVALLLLGVAGVRYVLALPAPVTCLANQMSEVYHMPAAQVIVTRGICTVQQMRDFWEGKKISEDGMRLEIYKNTSELVAEKPIAGHGIGNWLPLYQQKAAGQISGTMTTPHNDYLLYATELGALGVAAL
ncbi:MAG: O-antigen ligase family protein, partial [Burkholderiaceae bacterium]|nr:O-antigen ligase family protein [Burkholderiaceae bacterium]